MAARLINSMKQGERTNRLGSIIVNGFDDPNQRNLFMGMLFLTKKEQKAVEEIKQRRGIP